MTTGTVVRFDPAEEAEAIVVEAERDLRTPGHSFDARPFLEVLVRPVAILRDAVGTEWQAGLVVFVAVALLRAAAFTAFGAPAGSFSADVLVGAVTGIVSPFGFVAVAAAVLLAVRAGGERRSPLEALSLAFLAATPIALKALLQAAVMVVTRHALHPAGILGVLAPDSPALLRSLLGGVDLFALWAAALIVVAAVCHGSTARREDAA